MTDYFSHDVDAADDIKLQELQLDMGGNGYAIFWRLLELLWKNGGIIAYKPALLAYNIRWCTAEEVDQVITNYGLFEVQDGQFWSPSQLARRKEKDIICEERKAAARAAANARWKDRESSADTHQNTPVNADAMHEQCGGNADAMPNKLINKLINKSLSLSACAHAREKEERERIFIKFLFKNFKDPAKEADRYWSNYAGVGWVSKSGIPISDKVAYADGWKPEQQGRNFDTQALRWLQGAHAHAKEAGWENADAIPLALLDIGRDGHRLTVVFHNKEAALLIKQYITENNLADGWEVTWQTGTKRISK